MEEFNIRITHPRFKPTIYHLRKENYNILKGLNELTMEENRVNIRCEIEGIDNPSFGYFPDDYPEHSLFRQCITQQKYQEIIEYINDALKNHIKKIKVRIVICLIVVKFVNLFCTHFNCLLQIYKFVSIFYVYWYLNISY